MKYSLLALSAFVLSGLLGPAYGQTVATPTGSTGAPQVAAYQTSTGTWRKPLPVSLICTGGVACNYLTQSQAASTYLPLTGGAITGNLSVSGNITLPGSTSILSHDIAHILALAGDFSTSTQAITNSNNVSLVTYGTGQFNFYSSTLGLIYSISSSAGPTIKPLAGTGNAYACVNASGTLYRSSSACQ